MVGPSPDPTKLTNIKFLCSYGGKIIPRYPDGKLRYLGGETRVLAVNRSISFSELLLKLGELCGPSVTAVSLRCQLPTEDLDALVSIKSDEDLHNLVEEYDRAATSTSPPPFANLKIRAFLSPVPAKTPTNISSSPPSSSSASASTTSSSGTSSSSNNYFSAAAYAATPRFIPMDRSLSQMSQTSPTTAPFQRSLPKAPHCANLCQHGHGHGHGNNPPIATASRLYLVHNGNHWQ